MAKRKYTRMGEKPKAYECINKKCKWIGLDIEKLLKPINEYQKEHVCPKCGNANFYGLLENLNVSTE